MLGLSLDARIYAQKEKAADNAENGRYQYALGATAFDLGKNVDARLSAVERLANECLMAC